MNFELIELTQGNSGNHLVTSRRTCLPHTVVVFFFPFCARVISEVLVAIALERVENPDKRLLGCASGQGVGRGAY